MTALLLSCTRVVSADTSDPLATQERGGNTAALEFQSDTTSERLEILMILGLKKEADELVKIAIAEELSTLDVHQIDTSEASSPHFKWPDVDVIVTTGRNGCQAAVREAPDTRIICTLLTEEGFHGLDKSQRANNSSSLSALIIDQPVRRQMLVSNHVYPTLARFSTFSGHGATDDSGYDYSPIDTFPFKNTDPLSAQLRKVLRSNDALIATSDSSIYNASTLTSVLLTAYGHGKPVIGFSRAYVKAGALITCYSTPGQILRQLEQHLTGIPKSSLEEKILIYPEYFSVVDNQRVARSLGLTRVFQITAGKTYTDADFKS